MARQEEKEAAAEEEDSRSSRQVEKFDDKDTPSLTAGTHPTCASPDEKRGRLLPCHKKKKK